MSAASTAPPLVFDDCYSAVVSRDARFDGRFIVGVLSTGIYCRPSCPAPVRPKPANVRFFRTAAAARADGLRACKRCLPDASPGTPDWDLRADLAGRAMRLIADGVVDRDGVAGLARRLAVSQRHLHRVLVAELGATPVQIARSQRASTARVLIETTDQPFADVAFAAGFTSVRQFNDTVREVFADTPTNLRTAARRRRRPGSSGAIDLRLAYRAPLPVGPLLDWFAARAVPGVEQVDVATGSFRRTMRLAHGTACVTLTPREDGVAAGLRLESLADLPSAVERCRRLLDLDADPSSIADVLRPDRALRPLVDRLPGLRVPGAVDGFELAVRAVLGQQVSVAAARTAAGRLVALAGRPLPQPNGALTHTFPSPQEVLAADLSAVGLPAARVRTLRELAHAVATGDLDLDGAADRQHARQRLGAIAGIGPWTVAYVAMRALRDPDALPATDLALLRAARRRGIAGDARDLERRSAAWRPWRAYAAQLLWTDDGDTP